MMKVLWFANTPCGAAQHLGGPVHAGGWLNALESSLSAVDGLDLHIAFHWPRHLESFKVGSITYHPVRELRQREALALKIRNRSPQDEQVRLYEKVLQTVNPDLIHVHGTEKAFGLIREKTAIPVLISIQGLMSNYVSKYFSGTTAWKMFFRDSILRHMFFQSSWSQFLPFCVAAERERRILSQAKYVMGRTDWDRNSLAILAPNAKYFHGDELLAEVYRTRAWDKSRFSNRFQIVSIAGGAPYKGLETILLTAQELTRLGFIFSWKVIGVSSQSAVLRISGKLPFPENLEFLGRKSASEIHDILLQSDLFVQTSHIENSPNSLCEAMIVGMPIIATFAGGTSSLLCDGEEGTLIQDGDAISLAGAIKEVSTKFAAASKMAVNASNRSKERHNKEHCVSQVLNAYNYLAENGHQQ